MPPDRRLHCITGINPYAVKWGDDHYDRPLCPGLQPSPPSQTPGGLGQRYWSVSEVTWSPNLELRRWRSSGPSSQIGLVNTVSPINTDALSPPPPSPPRPEQCISWSSCLWLPPITSEAHLTINWFSAHMPRMRPLRMQPHTWYDRRICHRALTIEKIKVYTQK